MGKVAESEMGGDRKLAGIVQAWIPKSSLPVHLQIRHEGIPVRYRSPPRPRMQIHPAQPKGRRNQCGAGDMRSGHRAVRYLRRIESLAVQNQLGVKFPGSPTVQDSLYVGRGDARLSYAQ